MPSTVRELEQQTLGGLPFSRYEYVEHTFSGANVDSLVEHQLAPEDPDAVVYMVVKADRATSVYNDQSLTRRRWTSGSILLRSSVANAVVVLLLAIPSDR